VVIVWVPQMVRDEKKFGNQWAKAYVLQNVISEVKTKL